MRTIPSKRLLTPAVAGLCLLGAVSLFGHYTWLAPAPSTVKAGGSVTVLLANGHAFPAAGGKPVEGAEISVILGSGESKPMGKTDAAGRIEIEIPEAFRGPVLLSGSISKPAPAGSDYDAERLSSSYFLTWD